MINICQASAIKSITLDGLPIQDRFDTSKVNTAASYYLFSNLTMGLVTKDKSDQIISAAAAKWKVNDDHTEFRFNLKNNLKFSDNLKIDAQHFVDSVSRQIKYNQSSHFDFDTILYVKAVSTKEILIKLKSTNFFFVELLTKPEFGILHPQDIKSDLYKQRLTATSGPFSLDNSSKSNISLKKNKNFPLSQGYADRAKLSRSDEIQQLMGLKNGQIDLITELSVMKSADFFKKALQIEGVAAFYPHVGYTFFITIDPERIQDRATRNWIQLVVRSYRPEETESNEGWHRADQLYFPGGPGRISDSKLKLIWDGIAARHVADKEREYKVLVTKNYPHADGLIKHLRNSGLKLEVTHVEPHQNLPDMAQSRKFDLIFSNNDYSSSELYENLLTTFSPKNAVVFTSDSEKQYTLRLSQIFNTPNDKDRYRKYEEIAQDILSEGYIAPFFYAKLIVLHRRGLDLTDWSSLYPEIAIWKIKKSK